ncbi:MAG: hypothetical protein FWD13_09660 [Treponema sp.]|nr:hypothetical protein [Treponema sp.]
MILTLILLISLQNVFAQQPQLDQAGTEEEESSSIITAIEVEAYIRSEHNRSFTYYGDMSAIGAIELIDQIKFRGGIAIGRATGYTDINTFINAEYSPFSNVPVSFSLSYRYNGIIEYINHTHTILPIVSYNTKLAGISIGPSFRFNSIFNESPQFESILSLYGYINFVNNDSFKIGMSAGTFNDFYARNLGAYALSVYALMRLDKNWSIYNEVELAQSGGDGLSTAFYGFSWRGGARYSW